MRNQRIKHISLDLWGTLIKSNPEYRTKRNDLIKEVFGYVHPEQISAGKAFTDEFAQSTGLQLSYEMIIALMLGTDSFMIRDNNNFLREVNEFKIRNARLVLENPPKLISDDIIPLLAALRVTGYTLNILSNTSVITGHQLKPVLDMLNIKHFFAFIIFSDIHQLAKPNPDAYRLIWQKSSHSYEEILHVGDNPVADSGAGIVQSFIITPDNPITNLIPYLNATQDI